MHGSTTYLMTCLATLLRTSSPRNLSKTRTFVQQSGTPPARARAFLCPRSHSTCSSSRRLSSSRHPVYGVSSSCTKSSSRSAITAPVRYVISQMRRKKRLANKLVRNFNVFHGCMPSSSRLSPSCCVNASAQLRPTPRASSTFKSLISTRTTLHLRQQRHNTYIRRQTLGTDSGTTLHG